MGILGREGGKERVLLNVQNDIWYSGEGGCKCEINKDVVFW